jgi:uncharacterized protein YjiS (DUF1127 family)
MRELQFMIADDLPSVLDKLYRQFGVWKMARAIAAAGWRHWRSDGANRAYASNKLDELPDRMLHDIGLGRCPKQPGLPSMPQWERWR